MTKCVLSFSLCNRSESDTLFYIAGAIENENIKFFSEYFDTKLIFYFQNKKSSENRKLFFATLQKKVTNYLKY